MHAGPSPSFYDQIAVVHQKYANNAHGLPDFLTWHRLYLATFQEALWKQNPNVILPYWKWSIDSQLPHASEVLSNRFFGGNGDQSRGGCLSTGYFANWGSLYVDGEDSTSVTCVTRSYDEGNSLGAFYSPEAIDAIIVSSKTYDELRSTLEGPPHGAIHAGIGGSFTSMASSSDPIFWVHHAYVDMIWWQWQKRSIKNLNDFSGFVDDSYEPRHLNSTVEPFNVLNSDALNTEGPGLCYRYIDYVPNSSVRKVIQQTMVTSASTGNSTLQESLIFDDKDPRILRILRDSWQNEHYNNSSNSTNSDSTAKHPFNNSGAAKTNVKWALPTKSVYVVAVNSTDDSTQDNSALSPLSNDSLNTSDWPDFVTNGNENERQYLNAVYKATVLDKKSTWLTRLTSRTPELVQIKTPRPLSDNYIVMNGLNKKHVRQVEARLGNTIGAVNRLQNYISPASLLARQDDILRTASDALRYGQGWAVQVVDELRPMLHGFNQRLRQALRLFMLQKHH
ncbi:hypothetical protein BDF19DRAFT_431190 [Syncephalis fuscata]|nr:hypothetical protein BDF19DRAFT_431190 [Syncephalis fuscata]